MTVTVAVKNTGPAMFQRLKVKAPSAIARSLNRGAVSGRTLGVQLIAANLQAKQGLVKDATRIREARPDNLVARIGFSLKRLTLYALGARGSRRRGGGVSFRGKRYPHAFMATMPSGHVGIFQRKAGANRRGPKPNRSQLPIIELRGASVGAVFEKFREQVKARAVESFNKNLQAELRFALKG